jgi:hypothetical protein
LPLAAALAKWETALDARPSSRPTSPAAGLNVLGFMDVVALPPPNADAAEAVIPGDGSLDGPSMDAEAGSMRDARACDHQRPTRPFLST